MATKYGGYMGRVAIVDLSTGKVSEYPWSDEERKLYIGGKTMAAKILGDNLTKDTKALSAENMLVITTGPFTGSGTPSSSRFNISTLSPQTGIITSSNCGGNFGYYLKKAGFDARFALFRGNGAHAALRREDIYLLRDARGAGLVEEGNDCLTGAETDQRFIGVKFRIFTERTGCGTN